MIAQRRGRGSGDNVAERMLGQILTELDGIEDLRGVTVLGATNRIDMIDPAVLRPGRFDVVLEIGDPDQDARRAILQIHTRAELLAPDVDLDALAAETAGYQGAVLAELCREATMTSVREYITLGKQPGSKLEVTAAHFDGALAALRRRPGAGDD